MRYAKESRRCLSDFDEAKERLCLNCCMTSGAVVESDCWFRTIANKQVSCGLHYERHRMCPTLGLKAGICEV